VRVLQEVESKGKQKRFFKRDAPEGKCCTCKEKMLESRYVYGRFLQVREEASACPASFHHSPKGRRSQLDG
jgi:hypothetical protein